MSSPGRTETTQSTNSSSTNGNSSTAVSSTTANSSSLSSNTANSKTPDSISTANPTSTSTGSSVVTASTTATNTTSANSATNATGTRSPNQRTTQASPATSVSKVVPAAAESSPSAGVTTVRQSKPRPLNLQHSTAISVSSTTGGDLFIPTVAPHYIMQQSNANMTTNPRAMMLNEQHQQHQGPMGSDELSQMMQAINQAVRNGQFNQQLSNQISRLHTELKNYGEGIEQMHKEELNRVFVSLRQACCRDSGHLGTPCRLKIMELIELRAMGWRSNLQHSQYYINREQFERQDPQHAAMMTELGPISAPPLMTMNPFAFMQQGIVPANAAELVSNGQGVGGGGSSGTPQYYIIQTSLPPATVTHAAAAQHATGAGLTFVTPASGNVPTLFHQPNPAAFAPHFSAAPPPSAPPTQTQHYPPPQLAPMGAHGATGGGGGGAQSNAAAMNGSEGHFPRGAMFKQSAKYQKPYRVPNKNQFRDEIIIRNADSGKIMGVKGRRVAVVEELTKTIISFQKVPNGAKERTLTITGQDETSIEYAKQLIDQTIRRNASPARAEGEVEGFEGSHQINEHDDEDDEEDEEFPRFERHSLNVRHGASGGAGAGQQEDLALALNCDDPELLKITKEALKEYFERHTELRRSLTYSSNDKNSKQERKERRKSMPPLPDALQQAEAMAGAGGGAAGGGAGSGAAISGNSSGAKVGDNFYSKSSSSSNSTSGKSKKFQSTPNLVEASENSLKNLEGRQNFQSSSGARSDFQNQQKSDFQQQQKFDDDSKNLEKRDENFGDKNSNQTIAENFGGENSEETREKNQVRIVYTRDFLLQSSLSPSVQIEPPDFCKIPEDCRENLIRDPPGAFDPIEYKIECAKLKQMQIQSSVAAIQMN